MAVDINPIVKQILDTAADKGGEAWNKVQKGAPLYVKGYAQSLADIAEAVVSGDMTVEEGKSHAHTAELLLVQGLAFTSQVVLFEIQAFIDGVLATLKGAINAKLPVAIL